LPPGAVGFAPGIAEAGDLAPDGADEPLVAPEFGRLFPAGPPGITLPLDPFAVGEDSWVESRLSRASFFFLGVSGRAFFFAALVFVFDLAGWALVSSAPAAALPATPAGVFSVLSRAETGGPF
jgi:hypothetical protein